MEIKKLATRSICMPGVRTDKCDILVLTREALRACVVRGTLAGIRAHTATTVGTRQLTHSSKRNRDRNTKTSKEKFII